MGVEITWLPGYSDSHLDYFTRNLVETRDGCDVASARGYAVARRLTAPDSPANRIVTLELAKRHARIRVDHEDEILAVYLDAAHTKVEADTGVALTQGTFEITIKQFPSFRLGLRLPIWPVISVDAFSSFDGDGVETAAASPIPYRLTTGRPQSLVIDTLEDAWPTSLRRDEPGRLEVTAGYASGAAPGDLVMAVLQLFAHSARMREPVTTGGVDVVPIAGYRDWINQWVLPAV